jgi:hypothetical protein
MYSFGAEKCVNEIYHAWFTHGSIWDNALSSTNGPAPGYVPGGPNKSYSGTVAGINNQPPQKAYKDWNTGYPENSWEITEPSIYCQASYIMLLARLMQASTTPPPTDTVPPSAPLNLAASNITDNSLTLTWTASTDNVGVTAYEVYQGTSLLNGNVSSTSYNVTSLSCATSYNFTVKAKDAAGNISAAGNIATATTSACVVLGTNIIYDEVIGTDWQDWSASSTRNFNNNNPVKAGTKSIRVDYAVNGTLAFRKGTAVHTSAATELRFWVYNTGNNNINIFTESSDNGGKSTGVTIRPARKKWVEVVVSMSQLGNPAVIKKVTIQNNGSVATTFYFDEIRLLNVSDPALQVTSLSRTIPALINSSSLNVYPNPAKESVTISMHSESSGQITIELVDASGKRWPQQELRVSEGFNQWQLKLPKLAAGVYHIRMVMAGVTSLKTLLIQ